MSKGIGGHHSHQAGKDEWITPEAIVRSMGRFDLDPCAAVDQPWPCADAAFTIFDDGLKRPWSGRVWCNPPYGKKAEAWLDRMADHGSGIALTFARTDTEWFHRVVFNMAHAVLFREGRITFCHIDGRLAAHNSGGPSCFIAYSWTDVAALHESGQPGKVVMLK